MKLSGERGRRIWVVLGLVVLGLQLGSLFVMWPRGEPGLWISGDVQFGDLIQHYAAGDFWRDGRVSELYGGGELGAWLYEFRDLDDMESMEGAKGFNYVYGPMVAWVSSWGLGLGWAGYGIVWMVITVACWLLGLVVWGRVLEKGMLDPLIWLWALAYPPFFYGLILGQNHTTVFVIVAAVGWLLGERRGWLAGLVLSCLFFKPQWSVYLAVMMTLFGHVRLGVGWGVGTMLWGMFSWWIAGWENHVAWLGALGGMESGAQNQVMNLTQTWRGFLTTAIPGLTGWVATGVSGVIWAGLTGWSWWMRRDWSGAGSGERGWMDLVLISALGVFAMPYVMHYDAVMTLPFWLMILTRPELPLRWVWVGGLWAVGALSFNFGDWPIAFAAPFWTLFYVGAVMALSRGKGRIAA
jgi:hypothetical protein